MIGMLTFYWADDFGAMLQCFALKEYLNTYEKTVIIPYFPKALRSRYQVFRRKKNQSWRWKIAEMVKPPTVFNTLNRRIKMVNFRKKHFRDLNKTIALSSEIPQCFSDIDTYVVGSDQVWNPDITEGFQDGYFCTFKNNTKKGTRFVSYAASIGMNACRTDCDAYFKRNLQNFDEISIREAGSKEYLSQFCKKEPLCVLDPVFLLNHSQWEEHIKSIPKHNEKYIFVYCAEENKELINYANKLANEKGLKIYVCDNFFPQWQQWSQGDFTLKNEANPFDTLSYLRDAEYVVTNSFHGLVTSIIFEKQFAVFSHSVRSERQISLLNTAQLNARIVTDIDSFDIDEKIDYKTSKTLLDVKIKESKDFIQNNILKSTIS
ncbi:MAG: polysaccharide pyruvyl transferase family protein [Clostridium sp.]|nr:polysaccharide pyruvyl transferase family protein [Clostridium sp.]